MTPKVIKNDSEHKAALARIDTLMDVAIDTPECDELELLAALVEAYESKHFPIETPDPIAAIRFQCLLEVPCRHVPQSASVPHAPAVDATAD
jgi:HTH-type transcriptional regulator/antitoxin HigA